MNEFTLPFDFPILDWIQHNLRNGFCDWFFPTITHLGDAGLFWILLTAILLIIPKTRKIGLCSALALILDLLICNVALKPLIDRMRPYNMEEYKTLGLELLTSIQKDASFPSGHTAGSFASAIAIIIYDRRLGIPAVILATIIAFSRLYVAVHFPSDVFAGALVGIAAAVIAYFITKKLYPFLAEKLAKKKEV